MCEKERKKSGTWVSSGCFIFEQERGGEGFGQGNRYYGKRQRQRTKSPRRKGEPGVRAESGEEKERKSRLKEKNRLSNL